MNDSVNFVIDTELLYDNLNTFKDDITTTCDTLQTEIDGGYSSITSLSDGSSVNFPSKIKRISNNIKTFQEAIRRLVESANNHIDDVTTFESGNAVTIEGSSVSASSSSGTSEKITLNGTETLWNLAIAKGHEGADWNKVFTNADGTPITAEQARNLSAGSEILYVGGLAAAGSVPTEFGTIEATEFVGVAPLDIPENRLYSNSSIGSPDPVFGTVYASYDEFSTPFEDDGMIISTPMGYYHNGKRHYGNDFTRADGSSAAGTEVYPVAGGIVVEKVSNVANPNDFGNYVVILSKVKNDDGSDGYCYTLYSHLEEPSKLVPGQVVTEDDMVGKVGSTGNSTGPHLHLENELYLTPEEVGDYSLDKLYVHQQTNSSGEEINVAHFDGMTPNDTTKILWGDNGMFRRQTTSERNDIYNTSEKWADYVNKNSLASTYYDNDLMVPASTKDEYNYSEYAKDGDWKSRDDINY